MLHDGQVTALRKHSRALINDLDLTPDLQAVFLEEGIFNEEHIDQMMAEKTRKEQVHRMLTILKRRHPKAFSKFVHAIHKDYHWLAGDLRDTYHKIKHKKDPDMLDLKDKVAVYVHEEFGSSKRLCEEDKKSIRKFLYRHLKHLHDDEILLHAGSAQRRDSLASTDSGKQYLQHRKELELEAQSDTIHRVYQALCKLQLGNSESEDCAVGNVANEEGTEMDSDLTEVTVDMLEAKINEVVTKVQDLQSELANCHKALGISQDECNRPLHEVLSRLMEVREKDHEKISKLQEHVAAIDKQRQKFEDVLNRKKLELEELCKDLGKAEYSAEKMARMNNELQEKVVRLEQTQTKYQTLKSMVRGISSDVQENTDAGLDEVDGTAPRKSVNLPPLKAGQHVHRKSAHKGRGVNSKSGIDPFTFPWKF